MAQHDETVKKSEVEELREAVESLKRKIVKQKNALDLAVEFIELTADVRNKNLRASVVSKIWEALN